MKDYKIRIFSYLPNPRIWKTTITARLSDVNLSIKGTEPENIKNWLWDFNARELTETDKKEFKNKTSSVGTGFSTKLHKTENFLRTQPFGTVPAAFSPDGEIGIFESNSIMRLAARLGKNKNNIYGENAYESSRIDSFLDASLIFARASQIYLLSIRANTLTESIKQNAKDAYITYMNGIESALNSNKNPYLVGEQLTLADICFFCEYALFSREQIKPTTQKEKEWNSILNTLNKDNFTKAVSHYNKLSQIPAFAEDSVEYLKKIDIAISN
mgnify:FL=1